VLLRAQGRLVEALEQFHRAVRLSPTYAKAWIKLGVAQQELGLPDDAADAFQQALEIQPQYVELHYRLALLYISRQNFEEAVRHMEQASARRDTGEQVRSGLALSLQNMGLMDRVAATWRSLWRIHRARAG
jgi:Flp pilus assembly protein TadD